MIVIGILNIRCNQCALMDVLTSDLLRVQNRQMHDQMDYFLDGQRSNSYLSSEHNPQIVYR